MCNHKHDCQQHHKNKFFFTLILALLFFALGFYYKPFFIIAYLIIGYDVILEALENIIHGRIFDENFLMTIATCGAICIKEYPEAVMVMVLYKIGEYLQHKAVEKSRESISKLMDIKPDYANLNGEKVNARTVRIGDIITVKSGERIPLDGVVVEGKASLDTSSLTGETMPKDVSINDEVLSGCINKDGVLRIEVKKEFEQSTASKILELIENASLKKAKTENFIRKFAKFYTPIVVVLAFLIAFIPPLFLEGNWIERALTFLVISCPCALVISIPLSFFAGLNGASKKGVLIKGSSYIETLSKTKTAVFDKTGTLTKGVLKVKEIISNNPNLLKYAAYAQYGSNHPIAKAIKETYKETFNKEIPAQTNIKEIAGLGIEAIIDNKKILVGNSKLTNVDPIDKEGTIVYVSIDGKLEGYIIITDEIKPDSKETIDNLKKLKIKTALLTGDTQKNTQTIQELLNLDEVYSSLLPNNKVEVLEKIMKSSKGTTIFTGDGINDAPVLTRADVGISMGSIGSDAAIEASDVVIMDDKPSRIIDAIRISKKTMRIVKQNIFFALSIKALFLLLGSLGLMTMWGAVFADVGVTLIAVVNSLRATKA